jgi:tetratricopeptide (TPR) repeat protein/thiol-disulfide isomerase/thioredoxin
MKRAAVFAAVLFLVPMVSAQTWFPGTFDEALAKAKAENKTVLIDFYSPTWGSCKLLGEQFYAQAVYQPFLNQNFILFHSGTKPGDATFKRYKVTGTPTTFIVDSAGAPVDWFIGYDPPAGRFLAQLEKAVKGIDTFKSLSDRYAANPKDAEAVFKLALKYGYLYEDKALEKWKEGLTLDPEGKAGTFVTESEKAHATYTEYGEFYLARTAAWADDSPSSEPLKAFIRKYPGSELLRLAYSYLASAMSSSPKEIAIQFYEDYVRKFPGDRLALSAYLRYLTRNDGDKARGEEIAAQLQNLIAYESFLAGHPQTMAEFYLAKSDRPMAEEVYGESTVQTKTRIFAMDLVRYADFWAGRNPNRESVLKAIDAALLIQPENTIVKTQGASAYLKMGLEEKALGLIGPEFAKKNWGDSNLLWSYANFWSNQGKYLDEALAAARRMIELAPEDYSSWDMASQVYAKLKKFPEAIEAGEKAVALADDSTKSYIQGKLNRVKAQAEKEKK